MAALLLHLIGAHAQASGLAPAGWPMRGRNLVHSGTGRALDTRGVHNMTELKTAVYNSTVGDIEMFGGLYRFDDVVQMGCTETRFNTPTYLCIGRNLTIHAAAGETVVLDGGNEKRVLWIEPGVTASLHGLRITNGNAAGGPGGGILNAGTLSLAGCSIDHNTAGRDGGGGGIRNDGTLSLAGCSVDHNTDEWGGGGIWNNGGGTLILTDCSVHHNTHLDTAGGPDEWASGGIYNDKYDPGTTMHATNTTVCWNTPDDCSGCPPLPPCPPPPAPPAYFCGDGYTCAHAQPGFPAPYNLTECQKVCHPPQA